MHAAKVSLALAAVLTVSGWAACVGVAQAQETPQQATTEQKVSAQQEAARNQEAADAARIQQEVEVARNQREAILRVRQNAARQNAASGINKCFVCHEEAPLRVWQSAVKSDAEFLSWHDHNLIGTPQQIGTHSIGVTVVPADSTLRSQLGLPSEQGLVVTNVDLNSPASEAGVAQHDVLLRLGDKPLTSPDDLRKQVDAVGEKPVGLEGIRQGKLLKLRLTPRPTLRLNVESVKLQDAELSRRVKPRFWIGVELQEGAGADDALRAQLKLPQGQGVAVNNVYELSPAAKAGIKKHDVLLLLGDKPIPSAEAFRENLQEIGEKPVAIKLIREGKTISIEVTPQKHQEPTPDSLVDVLETRARLETEQARRDELEVRRQLTVEFLRPALIEGEFRKTYPLRKLVNPADPQSRLQELIDQVKDIQKKLEALSEDWKKKETPSAEPTEKK